MPAYIVLTPEEATAVAGTSNTGHRIEPLLLAAGQYGVPFNVLKGLQYADKRDLLRRKPVRTVTKPSGIVIGTDFLDDAATWCAYERTGTRFDQMGNRIAEGSLIPATEIPNQPWGVAGAAVNGKVSLGTFLIDVRANGVTFEGWDFRGKWLLIRAHDVSFVDCLFDSQAWDAPTNGSHTIVRHLAHYQGGLCQNPYFEHCTFDGLAANVQVHSIWPDAAAGTIIRRNRFSKWGDDPLVITGGLIEDNLIRGAGYCYGEIFEGQYYAIATVHGDLLWLRNSNEPTTIRRNFFDHRNLDNIPRRWEGGTWSGGSHGVGSYVGGVLTSPLNNAIRTVTAIGDFSISHSVRVYGNVLAADPDSFNGFLVANGNQGNGNVSGVYGVDGANWVQPAAFTGVYYPSFLTQGTVFRDFRDMWSGELAAPNVSV